MRFVLVVLGSATLLLAGCSISTIASHPSPTPTPTPGPTNTQPFSGRVMGGQQPINGAQIYLLAVTAAGTGSGSYGQQSTSLLTAGTGGGVNNWDYVTTGTNGQFTIPAGSYSCDNQQVYLYSLGGNAGFGTNDAAGLMAVLGTCAADGSFTGLPGLVQMNEVTTVAAAYALAGYASDATDISGANTSAAATGMANAALNAANLASLTTGLALSTTPGGNGTVPQAKINTLANALASCINSATGSAGCSTLFLAAEKGTTEPGDTASAAINIAHNPNADPTVLWGLATANAVFQPNLTSAPNDWLIPVNYDGGGLGIVASEPSTPGPLALDSSGNVWVANYFNEVTELSNTGQAQSPKTGFAGGGLEESYGLAVNSDNSVWVTDEQSPSGVNASDGSVTVLNSAGTAVSGANGYFTGGIFFPQGIAADTNGDVWVANYGDGSATLFNSTGTAISPTNGFGSGQVCPPPMNQPCLDGPVAVAIDSSHNAWLANEDGNAGFVTSISPDGTQVNAYSSGGDDSDGIAIDAIGPGQGHVWVANFGIGTNGSVSELEIPTTGSPIVVSTGYTGGGMDQPNGIAIDGAGNVWVANLHGETITELEGASGNSPGTAISPSAGFGTDASLSGPFGIAIDESGNVWVSNQGANTVTQFVGAAAPVKTPLLGPVSLP